MLIFFPRSPDRIVVASAVTSTSRFKEPDVATGNNIRRSRSSMTMTEPDLPFLSIWIPRLNVHITPNTFIIYVTGRTEKVGLVLGVRPTESILRVRQFLTWSEVQSRYPALPPTFSCWPRDTEFPPRHLCDTDLTGEIAVTQVRSLAFVFYFTDDRLRGLEGVANTFSVSSYYSSRDHRIIHRNSFVPFPSFRYAGMMSSCTPSMLFGELETIRREVQRLLNTRSLKSASYLRTTVDNIDNATWHYMTINAPGVAVERS